MAPTPPKRPAGPLNARDRCERSILAILLNEPHRWNEIQHDIAVQQFTDETRRQLAEVYWHHQRDEGEPVFSEFLGSLNDPELADLAVSLIDEADMLGDVELRLKEAINYLSEEKTRHEERKLLSDLRRTSGSDVNADADQAGEKPVEMDANDLLRKLQEKARRPDLTRIGR
jgi:hypothetical protein